MIRRAFAVVLSTAGVALAAVPAVAAVSAVTARSSQASLGSLVCRPAIRPLARMIEVTATMRPRPGSDRMQMRFQLLERLPGEAFHLIHGGDLGRWLPEPPASGQAPVTAWVVKKPVIGLHAPASYRFRVTFRWLEHSVVLATSKRVSAICVQP